MTKNMKELPALRMLGVPPLGPAPQVGADGAVPDREALGVLFSIRLAIHHWMGEAESIYDGPDICKVGLDIGRVQLGDTSLSMP